MLTLISLLFFKKVKSVLKIFFKKNKNDLAATWHGGRGLPPCHAALPPEVLSCRRTPRRQVLNAVRHGGKYLTPWVWRQMYLLEIFGSSIYFSKIKEKIFKKSCKPRWAYVWKAQ
jgi:hypothetical protein